MAEKKKFFNVSIPMLNEVVPILSLNKENTIGKRIKIDMTRKLRGKNLEVRFIVSKEGEELTASPYQISLLPYFIRRMFRKSISYVEDSFITNAKDSAVRIKPFLITRKKVSRSIRSALQKETKSFLISAIAGKNCEELFLEVIDGRLQKELNTKLKKIYPLSLCEIKEVFKEKSSSFSSEESPAHSEKAVEPPAPEETTPIVEKTPSEEIAKEITEAIPEKETDAKPMKEKKAKKPAKEKKKEEEK